MDLDHYWDIAEEDLEIPNPVTDRKLRLLDDYCDIRDGLKVLDIGCGKAWLLRQWAEKYAIEATGLESNPRFVAFASARPPKRGNIDYVTGPASAFAAPKNAFDVVMCFGTGEMLGGFVAAVDWMVAAARPGGSVVIGETTLKHRPLSAQNHVLPHDVVETIGIIERHGAEVSATISASEADFERYASHHRHSTLAWARRNPKHPNTAATLAKSRADWMAYLGWTRPHYGWTIFVARKADQ